MIGRFVVTLIALFGTASADTFPAYQWPADAYTCPEFERKLSEKDYVLFALEDFWRRRNGDERLATYGKPETWFAANPDCCKVYMNDHSWSLRESHTKGFWGWLTVLLESPTIMVTVSGPERDAQSFTGWSSRMVLLNVCGGVKDRFGGTLPVAFIDRRLV